MNNLKIRHALMAAGMKNYKLAELLGISEFTLSRKLRRELPIEEQERIVSIIEANRKG